MNTAPSPSPERKPRSPFASLFNLDDPAECFMAGWISRTHLNRPRLYQALALKRTEQQREGRTERLIYELARFTGRPACYTVITWNIDEVSMRWQDFQRRKDAVALYRTLL